MGTLTGLSGNEMYCLHQKGMRPGDLVVGNSVFSVGFVGGIASGLRTLAGGEVTQITSVIHEGRHKSFERMAAEASRHGGIGITGCTSELIQHAGNVEFLSIGSCVHGAEGQAKAEQIEFSTSADAQELYCQLDCGFHPVKFVFGNVAYSIGIGGGIAGAFRGLQRGEIPQFSEIFNTTRHLALERITAEARSAGANAVVGIETSIVPFQGMQEMVMIGTASRHAALPAQHDRAPVTSDLTNEEMWNLAQMGYLPIKLLLGVSVYSIGLIGGIASMFKGLVRGEVEELTALVYEARERAIGKIKAEADALGADDVVGLQVNVYQLGGGVIEFMAIGTAVKKMPGVATESQTLIPQAIIRDKDTFINTAEQALGVNLNEKSR
jgi:uncharacterized protein YbjQ (UPF0145 family)